MATYKEIRGTHIVSVTSDPPSPVNGQMWYNSTDKVVKGFTSNSAGAWASGGNMNSGRNRGAGSGIQTSALAYGGLTGPGSPNKTGKTESYNGTSWTEVNNLNTAREHLAGNGDASTSVLAYGGGPSGVANTESWNGTSWTELNNLSQARWGITGSGTGGASALATGGNQSPLAGTEEWTASLANKTITAS